MASRMQIARFEDFTGGLNLRDDAYTLRANELADCINMRIMPQGGIRQRKTLRVLNEAMTDARAIWPFYGNNVTQIVVQDGNDAKWSAGDTTFSTINPDGLTTAGIMHAATMARVQTSGSERLYVQRNAEQVAWKWDGSASAVLADAHGAYNDSIAAPAGGKMPKAKFIAAHAGFMFVANTVEGGTSYPTRLRWSHPGEPEDWRTNDFANIGDSEPITGIASAGSTLFIFKARSIWRLTGFDPGSFTQEKMYDKIGALSQEAIVVAPQALYFFDGITGVYELQFDGKLRWLWEKLACKLEDNTIPPTYVSTTALGWMDNRLWVGVPWEDATTPTRHFVFDPRCGKDGAWYFYQYSIGDLYDVPSGPMMEWRPNATTTLPLMIGNGKTAIHQLEYDENSVDVFSTSSYFLQTSTFSSSFTTAWFAGGAPGVKKMFKRPTFILSAAQDTTIAVETYKNYEALFPKSTRQITVNGPSSTTVIVDATSYRITDTGDFRVTDTAAFRRVGADLSGSTSTSGTPRWGSVTWNAFDWGATAVDDQVIVRGGSIGNLYSVQFKVSTQPGMFFAANAIELHYQIRRIS